jgi:ABC-type polysaccharide/polyol phosphate export permease
MLSEAFTDLAAAFRRADLWTFLGWHEVRQRYRRSTLGPFWITIATMIFVGLMTIVYSALFRMDVNEFVPLVASGLVIWTLISNCLVEGSNVFIAASATIRQVPAPLPVHVLKLVWQQLIYFLHNAVVIVLVLVFTSVPVNVATLLAIPAILVVLVNVTWMVLFLGVLGARYRDVPAIVGSFSAALFLATPVVWPASMLPPGRGWVAYANPFTYLLELVRLPIMGIVPPPKLWAASILIAVIGWVLALLVYARARRRLAYWL